MVLETALEELAPLIGGENNVSFQDIGVKLLYFRVKDQSLIDVRALQQLDWVKSCTVKNGRLTIVPSAEKDEKEDKTMASSKQIAENVLKAVGGKENVSDVSHCMTRLRFNLKDPSVPDRDAVKALDGVMGLAEAGGQFQVVIGNNVDKVYGEICALGGFAEQKAIDENLDKRPREPGFKGFCKWFFGGILDGVSGTVIPLIPMLMVAGLLKMILVLFGDSMGLMSREGDLYTLLTFCGDAGLYFLPIAVGYTGAKKFGASPILGILLGAMLVHPTFLAMATSMDPVKFTVYGIPCTMENYAQTIVPMILATWAMWSVSSRSISPTT